VNFSDISEDQKRGGREEPGTLNHNSVQINTVAIKDSRMWRSYSSILTAANNCFSLLNRATAFYSRANRSL